MHKGLVRSDHLVVTITPSVPARLLKKHVTFRDTRELHKITMEASKPRRPVTPLVPEQTESENFVVLPYVAGTSEPIKRILDNFGVKTALKPVRKIGNSFPKPKDSVLLDQIRGATYSISFLGCNAEYIGETKRMFGTHQGEHESAVKNKQTQLLPNIKNMITTSHGTLALF